MWSEKMTFIGIVRQKYVYRQNCDVLHILLGKSKSL